MSVLGAIGQHAADQVVDCGVPVLTSCSEGSDVLDGDQLVRGSRLRCGRKQEIGTRIPFTMRNEDSSRGNAWGSLLVRDVVLRFGCYSEVAGLAVRPWSTL